jgi:branched-chain amino acid transport system permease protein
MSTIVLLLITGLGLGALYFLVASGLSLIYGLMGVLNFAHGAFLSLGAFAGWELARRLGGDSWITLILSLILGAAVGAAFAAATEFFLIRKLYERHIEQVLVTVGLALAAVALFDGIWGTDPVYVDGPAWLPVTSQVLGATIPNDRVLLFSAAVAVLQQFANFYWGGTGDLMVVLLLAVVLLVRPRGILGSRS